MSKFLGAVMLAAAATLIGIFKAREIKASAWALKEILSFLELMRNEICTRRTPLKQILICANLPEYRCIGGFVCCVEEKLDCLGGKSFAKIWCESVDEKLKLIGENERQALKNLGSSLGKYDAELQAASIDRCISELTGKYEVLSAGLKSNEKMYIGLGTGIGLILAIILV